MGPISLVDKSTIQSFNPVEMSFFTKHYKLVAPQILCREIIADLELNNTEREESELIVSNLSNKLHDIGTHVCANHEEMILGSLFGENIPMDGRIPLSNGHKYPLKRGGFGVMFNESDEERSLRYWSQRAFNQDEIIAARSHRQYISRIDLEQFKQTSRNLINFPLPKTVIEVRKLVDHIFDNPQVNPANLFYLLENLELYSLDYDSIYSRWTKLNRPLLKDFSPYAAYTERVEYTFHLSLHSSIITSRPTNYIDRVYLFYLPFCHVFVSGDKFHNTISPALLRDDQVYISSHELKHDLNRISLFWSSLSDLEKRVYSREFGSYPPHFENSLTNTLWQRFLKPWRRNSGNQVIELSQNILDEVIPHLIDKMKSWP